MVWNFLNIGQFFSIKNLLDVIKTSRDFCCCQFFSQTLVSDILSSKNAIFARELSYLKLQGLKSQSKPALNSAVSEIA